MIIIQKTTNKPHLIQSQMVWTTELSACNHTHKQAWCVYRCVCSQESVKNSRIILCQQEKSPVALKVLVGIFTLTKVTHCSQDINFSPWIKAHTHEHPHILWAALVQVEKINAYRLPGTNKVHNKIKSLCKSLLLCKHTATSTMFSWTQPSLPQTRFPHQR